MEPMLYGLGANMEIQIIVNSNNLVTSIFSNDSSPWLFRVSNLMFFRWFGTYDISLLQKEYSEQLTD